MNYIVYVDDNYHYMDESERYTLGEFTNCTEAIAAYHEIVDEFLESSYEEPATGKLRFHAWTEAAADRRG